jgi:putative transposase
MKLQWHAGNVSQRAKLLCIQTKDVSTSYDWQSMLKANNLVVSMSRIGNCPDNVCTESFFALLKRERIRRKIHRSREESKADVFNYISLFYNSTRRHGNNNDLSPI